MIVIFDTRIERDTHAFQKAAVAKHDWWPGPVGCYQHCTRDLQIQAVVGYERYGKSVQMAFDRPKPSEHPDRGATIVEISSDQLRKFSADHGPLCAGVNQRKIFDVQAA